MATSLSPIPLVAPQLVLLDRDGVINFDSPDYIKSPEEWRALPGALQAIARLNRAGVTVAICSNQSGIGRGLFTRQTLNAIHDKLLAALAAQGGHLNHIGICPHAPNADCGCRKPKPGLLIEALQRCNAAAAKTVFIGDSLRDLAAAEAAGVLPILVRTGNGRQAEARLQESGASNGVVFDDLAEAVDALLRSSK